MAGRPSCIKCVHYYVTHDPVTPYGCRGMGFKSAQNPAVMVFSSSGIECQIFKRKSFPNGKKTDSGGSRGGLVA